MAVDGNEARDEWAPRAELVDPARFERGRIGPYQVGSSVRSTQFGEVVLAITERFEFVVELDLFDALANTPLTRPDSTLMLDLAQAQDIEHPKVARIIGLGIENGVPYVVRQHRLGRTLEQALRRGGAISEELATGILYTLAETFSELDAHAPSPGAWSSGGFDARDVYLCYDGALFISGIGLKQARKGERSPSDRDLSSLVALAEELLPAHAIVAALRDTGTTGDAARVIRRGAPREALARRAELIGGALRARFADPIREERSFFGLAPLQ